jgi:uncharacterized cupredoxin-like copper-binding protein
MRSRRSLALGLAAVVVVLLVGAGCGRDDGGSGRTVDIEMVDSAFEPADLEVAAGEEVTFRFTNSGEAVHEAFIGDAEAQAKHAADMEDGDGGGGHHGDAAAVTVDPGETETLTYTFDERGTVEIGCHQPGHYDGGMKLEVAVS